MRSYGSSYPTSLPLSATLWGFDNPVECQCLLSQRHFVHIYDTFVLLIIPLSDSVLLYEVCLSREMSLHLID